jgi:hypothetical protein
MIIDSITEEIRAIRRQLAAECGNDLTRILAETRQREATSGREYVTLPPRRIPISPPAPMHNSFEIQAPNPASGR